MPWDKDKHILQNNVADFGLSKLDMWHGTKTSTFCRTPEYLAHEVVKEFIHKISGLVGTWCPYLQDTMWRDENVELGRMKLW